MAEIGAERKPILRSAASGVAPKADRLEEDRDRPSRVASRRSRIARRVRPWQWRQSSTTWSHDTRFGLVFSASLQPASPVDGVSAFFENM